MTVLVTGATGRIGRPVVGELLAAGVPVRALSRTPAEANLPAAVDAVAGDLTDPESLERALAGVRTVFLLWTVLLTSAAAVLDRIAARAERVVLLSSPHQTPHPFFQQPNPAADLHRDLERLIAASGLVSTIIRPGMFASNALHWWAGSIRSGEPVRWPYGDADTAPIDERDVAAAIATVLCDDEHARGDYVLTGPESLSQAEQVRIIGSAIGRDVRFEELSPEEFRRESAETWPPVVLDMLIAAWAATMGVPAHVTSAVQDITGLPARTFEQWARDHAAAFTR
ncbi:MAG: hypothetical protein QOI82_2054 [Actinomycetota bacterium]|jgi:uncharacterized protein YbjT (DUF2867 family)|nr:hypothetical protein [Actinomycetota bacterium]